MIGLAMLLAPLVLAIPLREQFVSLDVGTSRKNPMHPGNVPIAAAQAPVSIRNFFLAHAFAGHGMQFAQRLRRSVLLSQVDVVILRREWCSSLRVRSLRFGQHTIIKLVDPGLRFANESN